MRRGRRGGGFVESFKGRGGETTVGKTKSENSYI